MHRLYAAAHLGRWTRDSKSFGGVGKDLKPFPRQCSDGCPPRNVQPVMGGQYQQTRLSVEAPSEPN
jgi:hypothetical protein